jgi:hypothetical protein
MGHSARPTREEISVVDHVSSGVKREIHEEQRETEHANKICKAQEAFPHR